MDIYFCVEVFVKFIVLELNWVGIVMYCCLIWGVVFLVLKLFDIFLVLIELGFLIDLGDWVNLFDLVWCVQIVQVIVCGIVVWVQDDVICVGFLCC